nr:glycoside hydrolase family 88 protein [Pelomonas sp. P8]
MPALLFDRALPLLPRDEQPRAAEALGASLAQLAARLQRPGGLFGHADDAPVAWGRGNGFAALGLAVALAGPLSAVSRWAAPLRERLHRLLEALLPLQCGDGLWRQVLDVPDIPGELTVTAMALATLSTVRAQGWLPAARVDDALARGWAAVLDRIDADGGFRDVCASTPAGPTLAFYRERPIVQGRDDRAAAMVLHAALAASGP